MRDCFPAVGVQCYVQDLGLRGRFHCAVKFWKIDVLKDVQNLFQNLYGFKKGKAQQQRHRYLSGLSSQVTSQHVNWNLLWFTLLLCEDIWAMVFLAIQPNLANPDLLTLCSLVSLLVCHFCTFLNVSCHVQLSELNRRIAASNPRQAVWNVSSQQIDVKAEHFYQALLSYTSNDPRWDVSLCRDVRNKQSLDLWVCSSSLWTKPTVHWETFQGLEHSLC